MMPGMGGQQGGYPPDADARSIDVQNLCNSPLLLMFFPSSFSSPTTFPSFERLLMPSRRFSLRRRQGFVVVKVVACLVQENIIF